MDEVERIQAVRQQCRVTVIAIKAVEEWARVHREPGSVIFTDGVDPCLKSQEVDTVGELAAIEAEARAYLHRL